MLFTKNITGYFSLFLITVLMLQTSMNTVIYACFKADQTYISKELCVNRFDETSTCKGNCYLKSKLQKTDTDTSAFQGYLKYKIDLFLETYVYKEVLSGLFFQRTYSMYADFYFNEPVIEFFHPPA